MNSAAAAIGRLIAKIARQLTVSISQPPRRGPIAPAAAPTAAQVPMARPRASPEKLAPRIARLFGISTAAPIPCNTRPASSQLSVGATAQRIEAAAKIPTPIISARRRPKRSPSAPPISSRALSGSR